MGNCFGKDETGENESAPRIRTERTNTGNNRREPGIELQNRQPTGGTQGGTSLFPSSASPPERQIQTSERDASSSKQSSNQLQSQVSLFTWMTTIRAASC